MQSPLRLEKSFLCPARSSVLRVCSVGQIEMCRKRRTPCQEQLEQTFTPGLLQPPLWKPDFPFKCAAKPARLSDSVYSVLPLGCSCLLVPFFVSWINIVFYWEEYCKNPCRIMSFKAHSFSFGSLDMHKSVTSRWTWKCLSQGASIGDGQRGPRHQRAGSIHIPNL